MHDGRLFPLYANPIWPLVTVFSWYPIISLVVSDILLVVAYHIFL